jgi:thiamine kinase
MLWDEACKLDQSLSSLGHYFSYSPEYVQTLTGGLTNRCWKVVISENESYVWRPVTSITKAFSISRFQEFQILNALRSIDLAPSPIYMNDHGLLVSWVEGNTSHDEIELESVLKLLGKVHDFDATRLPIAPFNYTARVDHYWILLSEQNKVEPFLSIYNHWRLVPNLVDVGLVLCHLDLAGHNIVKTDTGNKIIDWEYAAITDPRLDLVLSTEMMGEKPLEAGYRYCQLRGIENVDDWVEGIVAWQPRAKMMAMLWYLLACQLWGDEDYFSKASQLAEELSPSCER